MSDHTQLGAVWVVLPAAGSGLRFKTTQPKQFQIIEQHPLCYYSISALSSFKWISGIIAAVSPAKLDYFQGLIYQYNWDKVIIVAGGASRHASIKRGVEQIPNDASVVIVHDIVRPIIEENFFISIAQEAYSYGASGIVRPLTSTIIANNENGFLTSCLDRSKFLASETPQAFSPQIIKKAYSLCSCDELEHGTECLALVSKYCNVQAKLLPGPDSMWKVTYKKDLYALQGIFRYEREAKFCTKYHHISEALEAKCQRLIIEMCSGSNLREVDHSPFQLHFHELQSRHHKNGAGSHDCTSPCNINIFILSAAYSKEDCFRGAEMSSNSFWVFTTCLQASFEKLVQILQYLLLEKPYLVMGQPLFCF